MFVLRVSGLLPTLLLCAFEAKKTCIHSHSRSQHPLLSQENGGSCCVCGISLLNIFPRVAASMPSHGAMDLQDSWAPGVWPTNLTLVSSLYHWTCKWKRLTVVQLTLRYCSVGSAAPVWGLPGGGVWGTNLSFLLFFRCRHWGGLHLW